MTRDTPALNRSSGSRSGRAAGTMPPSAEHAGSGTRLPSVNCSIVTPALDGREHAPIPTNPSALFVLSAILVNFRQKIVNLACIDRWRPTHEHRV
jgi:hypothetical protein